MNTNVVFAGHGMHFAVHSDVISLRKGQGRDGQ